MLTPVQLNAIDSYLRKENWLLNEDLITELTDHYAAGLEERLEQGVDFDAAIREIHRDFGGRKGLLKMEEDYQTQKSRQVDVYIWREVHLFFKKPRIAILFGLLALIYWVNAYSGFSEVVDSFFSSGGIAITVFVFMPVLVSLIGLVTKRPKVNNFISWTTTISFYILYLIGMCQMLIAKYLANALGPFMSSTFKLWGSTLVVTLMIIYMLATTIGLRKSFQNNTKLA